jgi:hypothetical protein
VSTSENHSSILDEVCGGPQRFGAQSGGRIQPWKEDDGTSSWLKTSEAKAGCELGMGHEPPEPSQPPLCGSNFSE